MGLGIAVDFGTTCSRLAYFDGDAVTVLAAIPSEELGLPAAKRLIEYQCSKSPDVRAEIDEFFERPGLEMERDVSGTIRVCLSGERYTPEELCVHILRQIKAEAEAQLGSHSKVDRCAIGVPFGSTPAYHQLLHRSAIKAGFNWTEIVSELEAISLDLQRFLTGGERYVLICDMGGASVQVALLLVEKEREGVLSLEIQAAERSLDLGGWQLDSGLMDHIVGEYGLELEEGTRRFVYSSAFRREVSRARELLNWKGESLVRVGGTKSYRLSRRVVKQKVRSYENAVHTLIGQLTGREALNNSQIDRVFLVGGMSCTLSTEESFFNRFGNKVRVVESPRHCAVRGCAIWLYHWERDNIVVRTVSSGSKESHGFLYRKISSVPEELFKNESPALFDYNGYRVGTQSFGPEELFKNEFPALFDHNGYRVGTQSFGKGYSLYHFSEVMVLIARSEVGSKRARRDLVLVSGSAVVTYLLFIHFALRIGAITPVVSGILSTLFFLIAFVVIITAITREQNKQTQLISQVISQALGRAVLERRQRGDRSRFPIRSAGISSGLHQRLCEILLESRQLESDQDLRDIFVDARISPWRNGLPSASDPDRRVSRVIKYLFDKRRSDTGQNVLVLFLHVLRDRTPSLDSCHRKLAEIAVELERELAAEKEVV